MRFKLFKNKEKNTKNKEKSKINTVKSNTNDNERTREKSIGRSMVEMLGVLAIIGVLSIGGIQGYTMSMRKHKANEILNALEKYAITFYTMAHQKRLNGEIIVNDFGWWVDAENVDDMSLSYEKIPGLDTYWMQYILSSASGDHVLAFMYVEDKSVCEILANTTGDIINGKNQCFKMTRSGKTLYYLYLSFLMS